MWALTATIAFLFVMATTVKLHSRACQENNRYFSPLSKDSQEQIVPRNSQWQHHQPIQERNHVCSPKEKSKHYCFPSLPYCHALTTAKKTQPTRPETRKRSDGRRYDTVTTPFEKWDQSIWERKSLRENVFCYSLNHPAGWLEPWTVLQKVENKGVFLLLKLEPWYFLY